MKFLGIGGNNRKTQAVCLMAETNSVKDERLEAGTLHAESPDTVEAWGLKANQQCRDELTDDYVQFISSTHCKPVKIYINQPDTVKKTTGDAQKQEKKETALIASQKEDEELVYIDQGKEGGGPVTWLMVMIAVMVLVLCIVVLKVML